MTTSTEANFNQTKAESWLNCKNNHTISLSKDSEWVIFNMQLAGKFEIKSSLAVGTYKHI